MVRVGVRARREGNAGFELVRHLVLAAVLLREVLAHRVGWHSELAQRALDGLCACVAGAGQRHRTTVQELSTPAAPVTVAHPVRARRREHASFPFLRVKPQRALRERGKLPQRRRRHALKQHRRVRRRRPPRSCELGAVKR